MNLDRLAGHTKGGFGRENLGRHGIVDRGRLEFLQQAPVVDGHPAGQGSGRFTETNMSKSFSFTA